jgi:fumarate reductase iron-sulfur subunit
MAGLSLLEQRKIEARVLIPLIEAFESRLGKREAHEVVRKVIEGASLKRGREIASHGTGTPIEKFQSLIPIFCEGGALELVVFNYSDDIYDFNVTRCRYAEFYKEMGTSDLGFLLSCTRDLALARGISDKLELIRTLTIMQGAGYCDFRLRLKK